MKQVGFIRAAALVAAKDLRLEWQTWETLSSTMVFSLVVLVVFNFAFGIGTVQELGAARLVPGVIWTILAFGSVVGMVRSFQLERTRDTLSAVFLTPVDRGAIYLGKMLANLLKLSVLQALLLPLTALFFGYDLRGSVGALALVMLLHGVGLTELGTLFAGVTTRIGRGEAVTAILLFPAASPLLISGVKCTSAVLAGDPLSSVAKWLQISAAFAVLYFCVALLTFEFVLEE